MILAADRRVQVVQAGRVVGMVEGDKLVVLSNCAVATFGSGPPNVDVPGLIREIIPGSDLTPSALAHMLQDRISALADRGDFGALVVGLESGEPRLLELRSVGETYRLAFADGTVVVRGASIQIPETHGCSCIENLERSVHGVFLQVAAQCDHVGPPFDFFVLSGQHVTTSRR